ncbi:hypothetical protein GALL_433760 [mine drainage metagenome]|uniref:Periplasmic protein n=1 Tax=mine drainage metagenome TaxID=410659 RepID=A0A1J5PVU0_9ZZZZ
MKNYDAGQSGNRGNFRMSILIPMALASLLAISPVAHADDSSGHCEHRHWDQEMHRAFFHKRQQELHDKLALTAAQEAAWNAFVAKTAPGEGRDRMSWSELSGLSTPDRLDRMLASAKDRELRLETRVQATKEFYMQLTPAQQKIFDASFQHLHDHIHH